MDNIRQEIESILNNNKQSIKKHSDYSYLIEDLCKLFNEKSVSIANKKKPKERYFLVNYTISAIHNNIIGDLLIRNKFGCYINNEETKKEILKKYRLPITSIISITPIELSKKDYETFRLKDLK